MNDWTNKLIYHRDFFSDLGPLGGLLGLVLSAIVAGTNVDIAEVS